MMVWIEVRIIRLVHYLAAHAQNMMLVFTEKMSSAQFKDVQQFFETMPKLTHTLKVTNPNTKVVSDVTLEGLASFFG